MELTELIRHPEKMDRDTLYELRSLLALYPYYQTARLLMLKNLFLLHDQSFDEELRTAAIYITDRKVLFQMIEAAHYQLTHQQSKNKTEEPETQENRTISLIENFLDSIPNDKDNEEEKQKKKQRRKPTPADAAIDYVAYLLETESEADHIDEAPQMKGQELIDTFINVDKGKIQLSDEITHSPDDEEVQEKDEEPLEDGYFTETLARIYIKQGRYSKALEIIKRLSLQYPKKNVYFADQIRFLEKLIINNNNKSK